MMMRERARGLWARLPVALVSPVLKVRLVVVNPLRLRVSLYLHSGIALRNPPKWRWPPCRRRRSSRWSGPHLLLAPRRGRAAWRRSSDTRRGGAGHRCWCETTALQLQQESCGLGARRREVTRKAASEGDENGRRRLARAWLSWENPIWASKAWPGYLCTAGPSWPCPKPSSTNQTHIFWPKSALATCRVQPNTLHKQR